MRSEKSCRVPSTVLPSTVLPAVAAKTAKIADIFGNQFSAITFVSKFARTSLYQHRVPLVQTCGMNYELTLKGQLENLASGQGHDLTDKG